jgi:WD40 repeat protein
MYGFQGSCPPVSQATTVALSPNAEIIAFARSLPNKITLWGKNSSELKRRLSGHFLAIRDLAFTPSGNLLVSGSDDFTIRFWNVRTGQLIRTLEGMGHPLIQSIFELAM